MARITCEAWDNTGASEESQATAAADAIAAHSLPARGSVRAARYRVGSRETGVVAETGCTARTEFFSGMARVTDMVFRSHPQLVDHRREFPWLTGSLGDPFAAVWFVAENPSLTQVRRALGDSPELQWSVSPADKLFRDQLVAHGFKDGPPLAPGGWRCYITNVIKSAAVVKQWNASPRRFHELVAEAWAPVLRYELEYGGPDTIVVLGGAAEGILAHLRRRSLLQAVPKQVRIEHYSYIALRPDHLGRGPAHPDRIAEWGAKFAQIAHDAAGR